MFWNYLTFRLSTCTLPEFQLLISEFKLFFEFRCCCWDLKKKSEPQIEFNNNPREKIALLPPLSLLEYIIMNFICSTCGNNSSILIDVIICVKPIPNFLLWVTKFGPIGTWPGQVFIGRGRPHLKKGFEKLIQGFYVCNVKKNYSAPALC